MPQRPWRQLQQAAGPWRAVFGLSPEDELLLRGGLCVIGQAPRCQYYPVSDLKAQASFGVTQADEGPGSVFHRKHMRLGYSTTMQMSTCRLWPGWRSRSQRRCQHWKSVVPYVKGLGRMRIMRRRRRCNLACTKPLQVALDAQRIG